MVFESKTRKIGNSIGIILPKEALAKMNVAENESLYLTDAPDGGFRLTPYNPGFADDMDAAESLIRRYRHTLRELAK